MTSLLPQLRPKRVLSFFIVLQISSRTLAPIPLPSSSPERSFPLVIGRPHMVSLPPAASLGLLSLKSASPSWRTSVEPTISSSTCMCLTLFFVRALAEKLSIAWKSSLCSCWPASFLPSSFLRPRAWVLRNSLMKDKRTSLQHRVLVYISCFRHCHIWTGGWSRPINLRTVEDQWILLSFFVTPFPILIAHLTHSIIYNSNHTS